MRPASPVPAATSSSVSVSQDTVRVLGRRAWHDVAEDEELYELAVRFPEAVLALAGVTPAGPYRGEALEVKAASGRFDAVLDPVEVVVEGADARYYVEFQNRHD